MLSPATEAAGPQSPQELLEKAIATHSHGQFREAVTLYLNILKRDPDSPLAMHMLGVALFQSGNHDEGLQTVRTSVRMRPHRPDFLRNYAQLLHTMGHVAEAQAHRSKAYRYDAEERRVDLGAPSEPNREKITEIYDQGAAAYDIGKDEASYAQPRVVCELALRAFRESGGRACARALDLGCGTGLCAPYLWPSAGELWGVDLSRGMTQEAQKRGAYDQLFVGEVEPFLEEHESTFDVIVAAGLLLHIRDIARLVCAAGRALRPGGALAFDFIPTEAPQQQLFVGAILYGHGYEALSRVARECGLRETHRVDGVLEYRSSAQPGPIAATAVAFVKG